MYKRRENGSIGPGPMEPKYKPKSPVRTGTSSANSVDSDNSDWNGFGANPSSVPDSPTGSSRRKLNENGIRKNRVSAYGGVQMSFGTPASPRSRVVKQILDETKEDGDQSQEVLIQETHALVRYILRDDSETLTKNSVRRALHELKENSDKYVVQSSPNSPSADLHHRDAMKVEKENLTQSKKIQRLHTDVLQLEKQNIDQRSKLRQLEQLKETLEEENSSQRNMMHHLRKDKEKLEADNFHQRGMLQQLQQNIAKLEQENREQRIKLEENEKELEKKKRERDRYFSRCVKLNERIKVYKANEKEKDPEKDADVSNESLKQIIVLMKKRAVDAEEDAKDKQVLIDIIQKRLTERDRDLRRKETRIMELERKMIQVQQPDQSLHGIANSGDSSPNRLRDLREKRKLSENKLRIQISHSSPPNTPNERTQSWLEEVQNVTQTPEKSKPQSQSLPNMVTPEQQKSWASMVAKLGSRLQETEDELREARVRIAEHSKNSVQIHSQSQSAGEASSVTPNMVWPVKVAQLEGELQEAQEKLRKAEETIVCLEEGVEPSVLDYNELDAEILRSIGVHSETNDRTPASELSRPEVEKRLVLSQLRLKNAAKEMASIKRRELSKVREYESKLKKAREEIQLKEEKLKEFGSQCDGVLVSNNVAQAVDDEIINKEATPGGDNESEHVSIDQRDAVVSRNEPGKSIKDTENANQRNETATKTSEDHEDESAADVSIDGFEIAEEYASTRRKTTGPSNPPANDTTEDVASFKQEFMENQAQLEEARNEIQLLQGEKDTILRKSRLSKERAEQVVEELGRQLAKFMAEKAQDDKALTTLKQSCGVNDVNEIPEKLDSLEKKLVEATNEIETLHSETEKLTGENKASQLRSFLTEQQRKNDAMEHKIKMVEDACNISDISLVPEIIRKLETDVAKSKPTEEIRSLHKSGNQHLAEKRNCKEPHLYRAETDVQDDGMRDYVSSGGVQKLRSVGYQYASSEGEMSTLEEALSQCETRNREMERKVKMVERSCGIDDILLLPMKIEKLELDLANAVAKCEKLCHEIDELRDGVDSSMPGDDEVAKLGKALTQCQNKISGMEQEIAMVEKSCGVDDFSSLPVKVANLEQNYFFAKAKLAEANQNLERLREENISLVEKLEKSQAEKTHQGESRAGTSKHQQKNCNPNEGELTHKIKRIEEACSVADIEDVPIKICKLVDTIKNLEDRLYRAEEELEESQEKTKKTKQEIKTRLVEASERQTVAEEEALSAKAKIAELALALEESKEQQEQMQEMVHNVQTECGVRDIVELPRIFADMQCRLDKFQKDSESKKCNVILSSNSVAKSEEDNLKLKLSNSKSERLERIITVIQQRCEVNSVDEIPTKFASIQKKLAEAETKLQKAEEKATNLEDIQHELKLLQAEAARTKKELQYANAQQNKAMEVLRHLEEEYNVEHIQDIPHLVAELQGTKIEQENLVSSLEARCDVDNVDEIPDKIAAMERNLTDLSTRLAVSEKKAANADKAEKTICSLSSEVTGLQAELSEAKLKLEEISRIIQSLKTKHGIENIEDIPSAITGYKQRQNALEATMTMLRERCMVDNISEIPDKITSLERKLTDFDIQVKEAEKYAAALDETDRSKKIVEMQLGTVKSQLAASHARQVKIGQVMKTLKKDYGIVDIEAIPELISDLEGKQRNLEKTISVLKDRCGVDQIDAIPVKLSSLQRKLHETELLFNEAVEKAACVGNTSKELKLAESKITTLREDLAVANRNQDEIDVIMVSLENEYNIKNIKDIPRLVAGLKEERNSLEKTIAKLKERCGVNDVDEIPRKVANVENQLRYIERQLKETEEKANMFDVANKELKTKNCEIVDLKKEVALTKRNYYDIEKELKRVEREFLALNETYVAAKISKENSNVALKRAETEIIALRQDLSVAIKSRNELGEALQRTELDFATLTEDLQSKVEDAEKARNEAEREVLEQGALLDELNNRCKESEELLHGLIKECKVKEIKDIPDLLTQYADDVAILDELYENLQQSEATVDELQNHLNCLQETVLGCEEEAVHLRKDLEDAQNKLVVAEEKLEATRQLEKDGSHQKLKLALDEEYDKRVKLEKLVHDLKQQIKDLVAQKEGAMKPKSSERASESQDSELDRLRSDVEDFSRELTEAKVKASDLEQDRNYYRAKMTELQRLVSKKVNGNEAHEHMLKKSLECAELLAEKDTLLHKLRLAETRASTLEKEQNEQSELLRDIGSKGGVDSQGLIERLQAENERLLHKATELSVKLADCQMRIDEIQTELQQARKMKEAAENELDQSMGSSSMSTRRSRFPSSPFKRKKSLPTEAMYPVGPDPEMEAMVTQLKKKIAVLEDENQAYSLSLKAHKMIGNENEPEVKRV